MIPITIILFYLKHQNQIRIHNKINFLSKYSSLVTSVLFTIHTQDAVYWGVTPGKISRLMNSLEVNLESLSLR